MGTDLVAKKGRVSLCFGRSYHFKSCDNTQKVKDMDLGVEGDDIIKEQERVVEELKGYVKYTPKDIEDAHRATEDFECVLEGLIEDAQRLGSLIILAELQSEGFKFTEE